MIGNGKIQMPGTWVRGVCDKCNVEAEVMVKSDLPVGMIRAALDIFIKMTDGNVSLSRAVKMTIDEHRRTCGGEFVFVNPASN